MVTDPALLMALFDETSAFLVGQSGCENMIDEHQKVMSDGYDGALLAFGRKTPEFTFQIAAPFSLRPPMRIESWWCAANGFRALCAHFSPSRHFGGCRGTSRPKNSSELRRGKHSYRVRSQPIR